MGTIQRIERDGFVLEVDGNEIVQLTLVDEDRSIGIGNKVFAEGNEEIAPDTEGEVVEIHWPNEGGLTDNIVEVCWVDNGRFPLSEESFKMRLGDLQE